MLSHAQASTARYKNDSSQVIFICLISLYSPQYESDGDSRILPRESLRILSSDIKSSLYPSIIILSVKSISVIEKYYHHDNYHPHAKGKGIIYHLFKFSRKITPGDKLQIETNLISWKRGIGKCYGCGKVDNKLACSADFNIILPEEIRKFSVRK